MRNKKIFLFVLGMLMYWLAPAQTTTTDSIYFEGKWRNYRLFLPAGFNSFNQYPLVINFHGYGSNALEQEIYSGFDLIADSAKAVVCYPNGFNNSWNAFNRSPDDVGFVDTLITVLKRNYNINLNRVYATGMSNGGFMCNYLGCELSNRIAAIAPVAGTNSFTVNANCFPSRNVPVLYIHGTADATVDYYGSPLFVSAASLMELWSNLNGCDVVTDTQSIADINTDDLCSVKKIIWHSCDSNRQVVHYRIDNGGHTWPGSPYIIGVTNQDLNASATIWNFFRQFSLNTETENADTDMKIKILQDPSNLHIDIELVSPDKSVVNIYSIEGKLIQSTEHYEGQIHLDEINLPSGIYFINIFQNNVSKNFKIARVR